MNFFDLMHEGKETCIHDAPPPCTFACPLGINIRDFIKNMKAGLVSAAYHIFLMDAVMPGIVCHICDEPCKNVCVRKAVDEPISLRQLELFCWKQNHLAPKKSYFAKEKAEKILVCGDDLRALTIAVKLAKRNYPVDLAVHGSRLGGTVWELDETHLPRSVIEEEMNQICSEKFITVKWNTKTLDKKTILSYDAVFMSALDYCTDLSIEQEKSVFLAGTGSSHLDLIYQGNMLSYQIEEYAKIKNVVRAKDMEQRQEPYIPSNVNIASQKCIIPEDPDNWTEEEIKSEAGRCLECQCNRCVEACPMMQHYNQESYKQFTTAVIDTVEAQQIDRKRGLYPMMSCLQCGACLQACPVHIDTKSLCAAARQLTRERKILPPSYYQYWLNDMEHADTTAEIVALADKTEYIYFPGCQMGASEPAYIEKSYMWLKEQFTENLTLWVRCCGMPAYWAGETSLSQKSLEEIRTMWRKTGRPVFILACPTCMERFREALPEIKFLSIWELMAEKLAKRNFNGRELAIFDSCAAKSNPGLRRDIRMIAEKLGYKVVELTGEGRETRCCGYGGLVYSTNPALVEEIRRYNMELDDHGFLTYCTNCRDSFLAAGKKVRYILDEVFQTGDKPYTPGLEKRRENRMKLKSRLMETSGTGETTFHMVIPAELQKKMDQQLVLEEDVRRVVSEAQQSCCYVLVGEQRVAHKQIGHITIWVAYHMSGQEYRIDNVYFHRIVIKEGQSGAVK